MLANEVAEPGSQEAAQALQRAQDALGVLYVTEPPSAIAEDYEAAISGPDPGDRGEEWAEASDRVVDWMIDNCEHSHQFVEILRSD